MIFVDKKGVWGVAVNVFLAKDLRGIQPKKIHTKKHTEKAKSLFFCKNSVALLRRRQEKKGEKAGGREPRGRIAKRAKELEYADGKARPSANRPHPQQPKQINNRWGRHCLPSFFSCQRSSLLEMERPTRGGRPRVK